MTKFNWAVYNKSGALITRTLTKMKAKRIAIQFNGIAKPEIYEDGK